MTSRFLVSWPNISYDIKVILRGDNSGTQFLKQLLVRFQEQDNQNQASQKSNNTESFKVQSNHNVTQKSTD